MLEAAQLDKMDLHSFLDGITLPDNSLLANCDGSAGLFLEDSPNTSVDSFGRGEGLELLEGIVAPEPEGRVFTAFIVLTDVVPIVVARRQCPRSLTKA